MLIEYFRYYAALYCSNAGSNNNNNNNTSNNTTTTASAATAFDYRTDIISIRKHRPQCSKIEKYEESAWLSSSSSSSDNSSLSSAAGGAAALMIEDPFEIHYDVAHVMKGVGSPQLGYFKREMLRAVTLAYRCYGGGRPGGK